MAVRAGLRLWRVTGGRRIELLAPGISRLGSPAREAGAARCRQNGEREEMMRFAVAALGATAILGVAFAQTAETTTATKEYDSGAVYKGEFKDGKQDGQGTYTDAGRLRVHRRVGRRRHRGPRPRQVPERLGLRGRVPRRRAARPGQDRLRQWRLVRGRLGQRRHPGEGQGHLSERHHLRGRVQELGASRLWRDDARERLSL